MSTEYSNSELGKGGGDRGGVGRVALQVGWGGGVKNT